MDLLSAYQTAAIATFTMMFSLWLWSLAARDASIVDRFWGAGFVLIAWSVFLTSNSPLTHTTRAIVLFMVSLWGLRLSIYIHLRNRGHGEDYRYKEMRNYHGSRFWWYSLISVFLLQGALMMLVAAPVIFIMSSSNVQDLTGFGIIGSVVWLVGFVFEAGGDWQLTRFKKKPENKGQLLRNGFWSMTRHPNYFGDALQWWGIGCFSLAYGYNGILTLIGPLIMTLFIRKVSGVDLLEKDLSKKKPGYEEYCRSTPAFLPKLPFWIFLVVVSGLVLAVFEFTKQ